MLEEEDAAQTVSAPPTVTFIMVQDVDIYTRDHDSFGRDDINRIDHGGTIKVGRIQETFYVDGVPFRIHAKEAPILLGAWTDGSPYTMETTLPFDHMFQVSTTAQRKQDGGEGKISLTEFKTYRYTMFTLRVKVEINSDALDVSIIETMLPRVQKTAMDVVKRHIVPDVKLTSYPTSFRPDKNTSTMLQ